MQITVTRSDSTPSSTFGVGPPTNRGPSDANGPSWLSRPGLLIEDGKDTWRRWNSVSALREALESATIDGEEPGEVDSDAVEALFYRVRCDELRCTLWARDSDGGSILPAWLLGSLRAARAVSLESTRLARRLETGGKPETRDDVATVRNEASAAERRLKYAGSVFSRHAAERVRAVRAEAGKLRAREMETGETWEAREAFDNARAVVEEKVPLLHAEGDGSMVRGSLAVVSLAGVHWRVYPKGVGRGYQFNLRSECEGLNLVLHCPRNTMQAEVRLTVHGSYLEREGYARSVALARRISAEIGVNEDWAVSQIHLACDVPRALDEAWVRSMWFHSGRVKSQWVVGPNGLETWTNIGLRTHSRGVSEDGTTKRGTKRPFTFAVYDKRAESAFKEGDAYAAHCEAIGLPDWVPVTRIEGRWTRERLMTERFEIDTLSDLTAEKVSELWADFTGRYVVETERTKEEAGRRDRAGVTESWSSVLGAGFTDVGTILRPGLEVVVEDRSGDVSGASVDLDVPAVSRVSPQAKASHLMKSALGQFATALSMHGVLSRPRLARQMLRDVLRRAGSQLADELADVEETGELDPELLGVAKELTDEVRGALLKNLPATVPRRIAKAAVYGFPTVEEINEAEYARLRKELEKDHEDAQVRLRTGRDRSPWSGEPGAFPSERALARIGAEGGSLMKRRLLVSRR